MTNSEVQNVEKNLKENKYSPLRLVGILTITAFCTLLLITATFTRIKLFNCLLPLEAIFHPEMFPNWQSMFALKAYFYVPQIPIILFTTVLLGAACSIISVFFYIVIGLAFIPVFGLGGGFDYVLQPTFGYILAFIPSVLVAGGLVDKERSVKSMLKAAFAAVLIIHLLGFFYMMLVLLIKQEDFNYILDWILFESLIRAIYDFVLGFLCMLFAKLCRKFIWILTSI